MIEWALNWVKIMNYSILSFFRGSLARGSSQCFSFRFGAVRSRADQRGGRRYAISDAEAAFKDERYQQAIEKYRDIKNRYPYSARAVDSELRIADAYYEQESYLEAESAYEIFRELHPSHPKSDYVQYRIALSYYYQIPDNPQRDLSAAYKAIEAFDTLLAKYPGSEYAAKGKELVAMPRKSSLNMSITSRIFITAASTISRQAIAIPSCCKSSRRWAMTRKPFFV